MTPPGDQTTSKIVSWGGLVGTPVLAICVYALLGGATDLSESGRRVVALGVLMAGWWLTEAVPLAATSILPLALLPLLGVSSMRAAAVPYADELIYLFLGGFLLGRAVENSGLHRRLALLTLRCVGVRPWAAVAGIMGATAFISMWVSNTATAIMMLPIATSLIGLVEHCARARGGEDGWDSTQERRFAISLLLGLAYGASIGGIGTPLGTPPNLQFASNARELFDDDFSFYRWSKIGMPLVLVLLPLAWAMLVLVLHPVRAKRIPGGREHIKAEWAKLGPMRSAEVVTLSVFVLAAVFWIGREWISRRIGLVYPQADGGTWLPLTDAGVAVVAALLLFIIPAGRAGAKPVLRAGDVETIPWSILLLFGGGLSLAAAMKSGGVDVFLGTQFVDLGGLPTPLLLLIIVLSITLLSELASNTAVAATTLPVLAAAAGGMGLHPYELMVPATLAASCGFMLPVATPPNAIVFASGRISMRQMVMTGFWMDLVAVGTIVLFFWLLGPTLLGL